MSSKMLKKNKKKKKKNHSKQHNQPNLKQLRNRSKKTTNITPKHNINVKFEKKKKLHQYCFVNCFSYYYALFGFN